MTTGAAPPSIRIPSCRPALGPSELDAVREVFDRRWLSVGQVTAAFEDALVAMLGVPHVIGVASGTAALHLALEMLALGEGDEVIVPSITFVSAVQMIRAVGARPVFCDVLPATLQMDPDDVARRITPRTRALLPMHYGGYACDLDRLGALAIEHGLALVDDAAHAFGSDYRGRKLGSGTHGDLTCFSFSPVKNITCGEGGAITTRRDDYATELRRRRNLGIAAIAWSRLEFVRPWQYPVDGPGYRYALPNLNAAIGLAQLARCDEFRRRKQQATRRYDEAFAGRPGVAVIQKNVEEAFPYSYAMRVLDGRRDEFIAYLRERGIGTAVHYIPNHLQPMFAEPGVRLPVTEQLFEEIVSVPLFNEITDDEVSDVIAAVHGFFHGG